MRIQVVCGRDLSAVQAHEWSELQRADCRFASPFFCPAFTQAVASVRKDVFVGIMKDGTRTVGFFPFQRGRLPIGRPVGGQLSDYQGVITSANEEWVPDRLLRECGLVVWEFDHLIADQRPFQPYHRRRDCSPIIDVKRGFEVYARERRSAGSKPFDRVATLRRKLEREVGPLRFEIHTTDGGVFGHLLKWKSAQYVRSSIVDVFSFDWAVDLLNQIRSTQTEEFAGVLSALWAGDQLMAVHMGMRSRRVWHYWFPAYNVEFARYSPGLILMLEMAKAAPGLGIHAIDLGKGDSSFKHRLASHSAPLAEGCVELPSLCSTARQLRRRTEAWVRRTPLIVAVRIPGRIVKRAERRLRLR